MSKPCRYFWIFSVIINLIGLALNLLGPTNIANVILSVGYIAALFLIKVMIDGKIFKF